MRDRGHSSPLKRQILAAFLIPAVIFPLPLSVSASEPEYIAVLELHQRGVRPDYTRKITDRFREELSRYRSIKVLSRSESKAILDYHKSSILELGKVSSVSSQVAEAKKAYFELALNKANNLTQKALASCLKVGALRRDYRSLQEAYTVQGIIALAQHHKRKASESFRKLVYYNPHIRLDERYFAPTVIRRINRVKRELKNQELGAISVHAKPSAADVYVNGVFKGSAPLQLTGYPVGEHVVSVKAANYITQNHIVEVSPGKTAAAKISLKWKGKDTRFPKDMVGFHRGQFEDVEQLIGAAAAAAQAMRVRKLILISLGRKKGRDVVTAQIVDEDLETFHRPQSVTVGHIKRESAKASALLATLVLDEMNRSIMDDPQELAAAPYYGDVVLIGKSRSLLKSPWFWLGMGTLVAGGATAGVLAGTSTTTSGGINVIFR